LLSEKFIEQEISQDR